MGPDSEESPRLIAEAAKILSDAPPVQVRPEETRVGVGGCK